MRLTVTNGNINAPVNLGSGQTLNLNGTTGGSNIITAGSGSTVNVNGNVTSATIATQAGSTVNLGGGVTTLPKITGNGTVNITSDLSENNGDNDVLFDDTVTANGNTTVTANKPAFKGDGKIPGFGASSANDAASRQGSTTVSVHKVSLTGESDGRKVTAKIHIKGNATPIDMVFGPSNATSATIANSDVEFAPLVGNNVEKIVYTVTDADGSSNAKTYTFYFNGNTPS